MDEPPIRVCCGQRHYGVQCPDGLVMCCLCFNRVPVEKLHRDEDGFRWDMCQVCDDYWNQDGPRSATPPS